MALLTAFRKNGDDDEEGKRLAMLDPKQAELARVVRDIITTINDDWSTVIDLAHWVRMTWRNDYAAADGIEQTRRLPGLVAVLATQVAVAELEAIVAANKTQPPLPKEGESA